MDKKVDNRINEVKKKINKLDDKISSEKSKIKDLNNLEEAFGGLNAKINKCVELLNKSVKSPKTTSLTENILADNQKFFSKTTESINNDRVEIEKTMNELSEEKDKLKKELESDKNKKGND